MKPSFHEPSADMLRSSSAARRPSTVPECSGSISVILPSVRSVTDTNDARATDGHARLVVTGIDADVRLEL